ncbi:hypothetical protein GGF46_002193 [Coemansia sp. RSA 552]|nr:hypothetical protein GGF46_002193 [Coemansia sp. RSA 552]
MPDSLRGEIVDYLDAHKGQKHPWTTLSQRFNRSPETLQQVEDEYKQLQKSFARMAKNHSNDDDEIFRFHKLLRHGVELLEKEPDTVNAETNVDEVLAKEKASWTTRGKAPKKLA